MQIRGAAEAQRTSYRLGSATRVAPTVITSDLAHSEVTEIGADVAFVSAARWGWGWLRSPKQTYPSTTTARFLTHNVL